MDKGYVRKVPRNELLSTKAEPQWYLPHHPVLNPNKPEKVSQVCNAALKYKGVALNDLLMTGPDLLNNLIGVLMRFRQGRIALSADIEPMFLQVEVPEAEQRLFRFL